MCVLAGRGLHRQSSLPSDFSLQGSFGPRGDAGPPGPPGPPVSSPGSILECPTGSPSAQNWVGHTVGVQGMQVGWGVP